MEKNLKNIISAVIGSGLIGAAIGGAIVYEFSKPEMAVVDIYGDGGLDIQNYSGKRYHLVLPDLPRAKEALIWFSKE